MKTFKKGDMVEFNNDDKNRFVLLVTRNNDAPKLEGVVIESSGDCTLEVGHYAKDFCSAFFVKTNKIIKVEDKPKPTFKFGDKVIYTSPDDVEYNAIFLKYYEGGFDVALAFKSGTSGIKPANSIEPCEEI